MPINIDHYEELAGEVFAVYEQAEETMMRRVANRLNRGRQSLHTYRAQLPHTAASPAP